MWDEGGARLLTTAEKHVCVRVEKGAKTKGS